MKYIAFCTIFCIITSCKTLETVGEAGYVGAFAVSGAVIAGPPGAFVGGALGTLINDSVEKDEVIESLKEDKKEIVNALIPQIITNTVELPATFTDYMRKFWYISVFFALIGLITHPKWILSIPMKLISLLKKHQPMKETL